MNISDLRSRARDEGGNALVMVIGLGFTFLILAVTMAVSSTYAATTASSARAGVQAQAAADAGIDNAVKQLNNVLIGKESSFRCVIDSEVGTEHGTAAVTTQIRYRLAGAGDESPYTCNAAVALADGSEVQAAEIVSTATITIGSANGAKEQTRTVKQTVARSIGDPLPPVFNYGVFSHSSVIANNNFTVDGGGLFTNGNFACNSASAIYGDVVAIGSAQTDNNCRLDSLWTGGQISCRSGSVIVGNLTSSFTGLTSLDKCSVGGSAWTAGNISMNNSTITDNALSATGAISVCCNAKVGGWAQGGGKVTTSSGGTIGSARVENLPTELPASPASQKMPAIYWKDLTGVKADNPPVVNYGAWLKENAVRNNAPSWSALRSGTHCTGEVASANYSLNGHLITPDVASVIDARGCAAHWNGSLNLTVGADTTLVLEKFTSSNGLKIKGKVPGQKYVLRIIVPLPDGAPSCSGQGKGNIAINSGGSSFDPNVTVFIYTNGRVNFTNKFDMYGSVYGCETEFDSNTKVTYSDGTPPGMVDDSNRKYNFSPVMRFDVRP